jgi:hypothetical protein
MEFYTKMTLKILNLFIASQSFSRGIYFIKDRKMSGEQATYFKTLHSNRLESYSKKKKMVNVYLSIINL